MPGWGKCIVQTHSASTGGEKDSLVSVLQAKCRIECVKWRTWDVENDSLVILLETKGEDSVLVSLCTMIDSLKAATQIADTKQYRQRKRMSLYVKPRIHIAMTCVGWVDKAFLSELHIKKLQFLKVK